MNTANRIVFLGALLWTTLTVGCAPAYRSYSGCYVDCKYCPPPPLSYVHYKGCVCHSRAAQPHLVGEPNQLDAVDLPQPPDVNKGDE